MTRARVSRLGMVLGLFGLLATTFLAAAPASAAVAGDRSAGQSAATMSLKGQRLFWYWSDDYAWDYNRTFDEARWGDSSYLPTLKLQVKPVYPARRVILEYLEDGSWTRESSNWTNRNGIATVRFDPYCADGQWCDGTWKYRLRVLPTGGYSGATKQFQITYVSY